MFGRDSVPLDARCPRRLGVPIAKNWQRWFDERPARVQGACAASAPTFLGATVYRASGIGISIVMIAAGAVLAWAVTVETSGVDLNTVGLILFFVGIAGFVISLLVSMTPSRVSDTTVVDRSLTDRPVVERERVEY